RRAVGWLRASKDGARDLLDVDFADRRFRRREATGAAAVIAHTEGSRRVRRGPLAAGPRRVIVTCRLPPGPCVVADALARGEASSSDDANTRQISGPHVRSHPFNGGPFEPNLISAPCPRDAGLWPRGVQQRKRYRRQPQEVVVFFD